MPTTKTLWSDLSRTRHFLVPDGEKLSSGNFILRTPTGQQLEVDPDALASYEVTREQAKAWLKEQFGQVLAEAKGTVMNALRQGLTHPPDFQQRPQPHSPSATDPLDKPADSPILSLLSALSEEPVTSLGKDTESLLREIKKIAAELGGIFQDATATEEDGLDNARRRIRQLRTRLHEQGLPLSERMEEIPDWIRQQYQSAQQSGNAERTAASLINMADELEQAGAFAAQKLRALAQQLREDDAPLEIPAKQGDDINK